MPTTGLLHEPKRFFRYPFYLIQASLQRIKMKKAQHYIPGFDLVPTTGFEPARLLAPPPQDGMSTNFTTWALTETKIQEAY